MLACIDIDDDPVTVANVSERSSVCSFGRHVPGHQATDRTRRVQCHHVTTPLHAVFALTTLP